MVAGIYYHGATVMDLVLLRASAKEGENQLTNNTPRTPRGAEISNQQILKVSIET
jgi:hypothetical protein